MSLVFNAVLSPPPSVPIQAELNLAVTSSQRFLGLFLYSRNISTRVLSASRVHVPGACDLPFGDDDDLWVNCATMGGS